MKILITGIAGFLGSNLARYFISKNIPVVGIDNFDVSYPIKMKKWNIAELKKSELVEFIEGDINDKKFLASLETKGITHICHMAAKANVRESTLIPQEYLETNILGTLNILQFALKINAKKTILASTSSIYGANKPPYSENQTVSTPLSIYAASKLGMENLAYTFHSVYGLPIISIRFFTAYGPGGRPDMAVYKFTDLILNNKEIELWGNGSEKRDYTFVSDIAEGVYLALNSKENYAVFNLGSSQARSLNELISLIEKSTGEKAKIIYVKKNKEDPDITLADISKAKKVLGYNPKISLDEGISLFVKWFIKYKKKSKL
ncbi:MAG: GDP-mannose 4,6-dehydratase [archaeon]|nr:GDP-mannose 4,6-dehydratase [archaeon]